MISKHLTIAAAFAILTGFVIVPAMAQDSSAPAAAPTATTDQQAPAPAAAATPAAKPAAVAEAENPYGLMDIIKKKNPVSYAVLCILAIMSIGTWYYFFTRYLDQGKILGQSKTVERRFWTSGSLNEGIDKLPKGSLFRAVAEAGVKASEGGTSLVGLNDWIAMSLNRQIEDANGQLQGGVTFLGTTGSVAPFVGLFGTVWGILQALIAIGVAGQASIDKVAGPVGEALIMTALGLFVAVPAVMIYNMIVRRNRVIMDKLRGFAGDLQTYLITKSK
jgi:biopolymer transport protein ExbB